MSSSPTRLPLWHCSPRTHIHTIALVLVKSRYNKQQSNLTNTLQFQFGRTNDYLFRSADPLTGGRSDHFGRERGRANFTSSSLPFPLPPSTIHDDDGPTSCRLKDYPLNAGGTSNA